MIADRPVSQVHLERPMGRGNIKIHVFIFVIYFQIFPSTELFIEQVPDKAKY
jgi:hypothetical protein